MEVQTQEPEAGIAGIVTVEELQRTTRVWTAAIGRHRLRAIIDISGPRDLASLFIKVITFPPSSPEGLWVMPETPPVAIGLNETVIAVLKLRNVARWMDSVAGLPMRDRLPRLELPALFEETVPSWRIALNWPDRQADQSLAPVTFALEHWYGSDLSLSVMVGDGVGLLATGSEVVPALRATAQVMDEALAWLEVFAGTDG